MTDEDREKYMRAIVDEIQRVAPNPQEFRQWLRDMEKIREDRDRLAALIEERNRRDWLLDRIKKVALWFIAVVSAYLMYRTLAGLDSVPLPGVIF